MLDLGDTYTTSIEVYTAPPEEGGALVNPSTVVLTITLPDGTTATPSPTNTGPGKYKLDYITAQAGRHLFRWLTAGPATAWTDTIDVRSAAPAFIVSLADMKRHLNKSAVDTADDEELREFIEATTVIIEDHRKEAVVRRTVVEDIDLRSRGRVEDIDYLRSRGAASVVLGKAPIVSLTSVATVDATMTWNVANLHVGGSGNVVTVESGPVFWGLVRFTYVAGYAVIPANYILAAKIIVQHLWETQRQAGLGPRSPFAGDMATTPAIGQGFAIPYMAAELLGGRSPTVA